MASAITWFQIPATDSARAKAFYEKICGFELLPLDAGPDMEMWGFPSDWRQGEVGGGVAGVDRGKYRQNPAAAGAYFPKQPQQLRTYPVKQHLCC